MKTLDIDIWIGAHSHTRRTAKASFPHGLWCRRSTGHHVWLQHHPVCFHVLSLGVIVLCVFPKASASLVNPEWARLCMKCHLFKETLWYHNGFCNKSPNMTVPSRVMKLPSGVQKETDMRSQ